MTRMASAVARSGAPESHRYVVTVRLLRLRTVWRRSSNVTPWRYSVMDSDPVRLALRPFDQQPLFRSRLAPAGVTVRRTNPRSGEPRGQWRVAAVPSRDQFQSEGLG